MNNRMRVLRADLLHDVGASINPGIDMGQVHARKDKIVSGLTKGIEYLFKKQKVEWIKGYGRLAGPGRVEVFNSEGQSQTIEARAVISAVGQLNRPKRPDIEGLDDFTGLAMHSAQWVEGTDLDGQRVAVIGTGASAFQIVPTVADQVEHLTVFQRTAPL